MLVKIGNIASISRAIWYVFTMYTKSLTAFLPTVRTNYYHSATSYLRDGLMFMLASGRNAARLVFPPFFILSSVFCLPYSVFIQSKTLTLKNKNQIFQNFLSPIPTTTYGPRAPGNELFFGSKLHTHLIIEDSLP